MMKRIVAKEIRRGSGATRLESSEIHFGVSLDQLDESKPDWDVDLRIEGAFRRLHQELSRESYSRAQALFGDEVVDAAFYRLRKDSPEAKAELSFLKNAPIVGSRLGDTKSVERTTRLVKSIPEFSPGDTVIVSVNVVEGSRKSVQTFEGVVISKRNRGLNSGFIVSKNFNGERVERTFLTYSSLIDGIEVKRRGDVRRAKLYSMRDRRGKSARISGKLSVKKIAA